MTGQTKTQTTKLIRAHSGRSANKLGNAIGEPNLTRKLGRIRTNRLLLQADVLDRIGAELGPVGRRLLVATMAADAKLPGYESPDDLAFQALINKIRSLDDRQRMTIMTLIEDLTPTDTTEPRAD